MADKGLLLVEHLQELRARLIRSVIAIIAASCIFYAFSEKVLRYLVKPVGGLVFIAPAEAFIATIKVAFFGGLFLSSPLIIYEIWQFIQTGLKKDEKKYALFFAPASFTLFILGVCFGYFIIVPIGLDFLLRFATDFMTPMITASKYISFIGTLTLSFGVVFEIPLISLFLTKIGVVTPDFLSRRRKHAVVFVFIAAAILTPPDVVTQCLMALPLLVLYEVGIIFSGFIYRKKQRERQD